MSSEKLFTREMREATMVPHALSDRLVNAKLAIALSNDKVWTDGLLAFCDVFRYLESAMARQSHTLIGELNIEGLARTKAFEKDLDYYTGFGWRMSNYMRPSVVEYVLHLNKLEREEPILLLAYIYHLYMGILSGGLILKKKREFYNRFVHDFSRDGYEITNFGKLKIDQLKQDLTTAMNNVAQKLDTNTKAKLIEESKRVFILNNELIKSVEGTNEVVFKKVFTGALIAIPIAWMIYKAYF